MLKKKDKDKQKNTKINNNKQLKTKNNNNITLNVIHECYMNHSGQLIIFLFSFFFFFWFSYQKHYNSEGREFSSMKKKSLVTYQSLSRLFLTVSKEQARISITVVPKDETREKKKLKKKGWQINWVNSCVKVI